MFDTLVHTLTADVATSGTFTVSYPANRSAGSYTGAHKHKMIALNAVRSAPDDFSLSFGASSITVTHLGSTTLPATTTIRLQLDRVGADDGEPEKVALPDSMTRMNLMRIDLGSPDTADADGVAASQSVSAGASFTLNGALVSDGVAVFDVPRNVVAAWTTTSILTITGTDADGNTVVEKSASGTAHTGSKAFKTVTSVSSSASITSATVGTGTKIGLPRYIHTAAQVVEELKDGAPLPRRSSVVTLTGLQTEANVDAGTSLWLTSPVAGYIRKLTTVAQSGITTGGNVTVELNGTAVDGLTVAIANSAVAGEVDSDTATAAHATALVAAGDEIEIVFDSAFNASADILCTLEIDTTAAGRLDGTLVAGVTTAATATTGDTRGTYTPSTAPDGATAYELWAYIPDPANQGVAQYDG